MPLTHTEPTRLGDNEHENKTATRDSPGEAPDPGAKANGGEVKAMAVSVMAIAKGEEGAAGSQADQETKDEDEQEADNEEGEDDGKPGTDSEEGGGEDDDNEQEPTDSATAKDAVRKATRRARYLKNREKIKLQKAAARANEDKEVQQLCAALAVKRDKPTNSTYAQECRLLGRHRGGRAWLQYRVDYKTWMTWLRCPICGTRRANEKLLALHQRKEYVGEKTTQKRKDARAEAGMEVEDQAELWKDEEAELEKDKKAELEKGQ